MKVVCNSSPLVNLARIGRLHLLEKLYIEHILPVVAELRTKAGFRISKVLFKHIETVSGEYSNT